MAHPAAKSRVVYRATVKRAIIGLGVAAVVGATALESELLFSMLSMLAAAHRPLPSIPWWGFPRRVLFLSLEMLPVVAMAAPIWWAFDRRGVRQWWAAALVGAAICGPGAVLYMLITLYAGKDSPPTADFVGEIFAWTAGAGAVMGLVAWRIAYRRDPSAADVAEAF